MLDIYIYVGYVKKIKMELLKNRLDIETFFNKKSEKY